jgi:acyl carrier protein
MKNRIKKVMGNVFSIDENSINNESSPDSIESWDSLKHMNLLVALEEEFNVEFDDDSLESLLNFKLIYLTIKECSNNN